MIHLIMYPDRITIFLMRAFKVSYWAVSPRYLLVFQMLAADRRAMYDFPQITKITLIGERY